MPYVPQQDMFDRILERKGAFFVVFFFVFMATYGVLYAIDFVPEAPAAAEPVVEVIAQEEPAVVEETRFPYPERIIIDSLDREVVVQNPQSRTVKDLDAALLKGVVRHPDSADFADKGNILLFGHSSGLPTVFNQNFKAFNGIQHLVWGDTIRLQSADTEYVYRVQRVYKVKASEADVALDNSAPRLTLITCNSFGTKDDRFVVEADLIETRPL